MMMMMMMIMTDYDGSGEDDDDGDGGINSGDSTRVKAIRSEPGLVFVMPQHGCNTPQPSAIKRQLQQCHKKPQFKIFKRPHHTTLS